MALEKAWGLEVNPDQIPGTLKKLNNWIIWTAVHKGSHVDKVPKRPDNPRLGCSINQNTHLTTFADAYAAHVAHAMSSGVGFVMNKEEGLFGIDIDNCIDAQGNIEKWAQYLVDNINTYWELSPSQRGLRAFVIGALPGKSFINRQQGLEMYGGDSARFLTVTGHRIGDTSDIKSLPAEKIEKLYKRYSTATPDGEELPMPEELQDCPDFQALPEHHFEFLTEQTVDARYPSRSEALLGATMALYRLGYTDAQVFTTLVFQAIDVALDHRRQDPDRARKYLWDTCLKSRALAGAGSVVDEFDIVIEKENEKQSFDISAGTVFAAASWQGQTVQKKEWLLDQWIPIGNVTALYGDGGVGKSLLSLDLQTAVATGNKFFDIATRQAGALGIYCEDSVDDLHMRQDGINSKYMVNFDNLTSSFISSRLGQDNLMMTFDGKDRGSATSFHESVCRFLTQHPDIRLVVIDTAADTFGGNENIRPQVRQFVQNCLGHIALTYNVALVLCAHPSVAGMNQGTGGSTAWSNSVRSRLFLQRDPELPELRILTKKKSNYSTSGDIKRMIWKDGAFVPEMMAQDVINEPDKAMRQAFVSLLTEATARRTSVSTSVRGNYAPRVLATMARNAGRDDISVPRLARAMEQLLARRQIEVVAANQGRTSRLVIKDENT